MHRESHTVDSRYLFTVWLVIFTAGLILLAAPAVAGGVNHQWIYELCVLAGMAFIVMRQLRKSRLVFIYQFIGNELVVRCQAGNRVSVCAHVHIDEMEKLVLYRDLPLHSRRQYTAKNLCGRPKRQRDYYLLYNGAKGKKAIVFEPSARLAGLLCGKIKEKGERA